MRYSRFLAIILVFPTFASAQVLITEVMYDLAEGTDSGREWVEIYNGSASSISVTGLRLFENGTNHKISGVGGDTLPSGGYAIIADNPEKFKADYPAYTAMLFDSAFSLSNAGETILLRTVAGGDIDSVTYTESLGGKGTGDSLQRLSSGSFDAGIPTPGRGIPEGGLQKSPPKEKKLGTKGVKTLPAVPMAIVGERAKKEEAQVAGASVAPQSFSTLFLLGAGALGVVGSIGMVAARRIREDEWEIEEID